MNLPEDATSNASHTEAKKSVSQILEELEEKDQQYRSSLSSEARAQLQNNDLAIKERDAIDSANRAIVQDLLDKGLITEPMDYYRAGLIFQHGETPQDWRQAFELSFKAAELGIHPGITVLSQAFDRYMVTLQEGRSREQIRQRFGTQSTSFPGQNEDARYYYQRDGKASAADFDLFACTPSGEQLQPDEFNKQIADWEKLSYHQRKSNLKRLHLQFMSLTGVEWI